MFLLESASAASRRRACAAARLKFPQDNANTNTDAVESVDVTNANDNAVAPKSAADARANADDPSDEKSSTDTAADRTASISVDDLDVVIANATNARRPAPTPLYTTVTNTYKASWNLGDTKQMATFVRAAEPESDHVRFNVGVPNASTLMDLVDDKASLYRWDHLMNVPVEGTGVIALLPEVLVNGTKFCDAGFTKFMNPALYYTTRNLKHCQQYVLWYNGCESAKLDKTFRKDFKTLFIESVNTNHATENIRLSNQWNIQLRTISKLVLRTLRSHITLASFKSFMPYKISFDFLYRMTGVVKYNGLIILRMMIKISKPDTVTNIPDIEIVLDVNKVNKCISHQQQFFHHTHTHRSIYVSQLRPPLSLLI